MKISYQASDLAGELSGRSEEQVNTALRHLSEGDLRIIRASLPPPNRPQILRYEIFHDVLSTPILDWRNRFVQRQLAEQELAAEKRAAVKRRLFALTSALVVAIGVAAIVLTSRARIEHAVSKADDASANAQSAKQEAGIQATQLAKQRVITDTLGKASLPPIEVSTPVLTVQGTPTATTPIPASAGEGFYNRAIAADRAGDNRNAINLYQQAIGQPDISATSAQSAELRVALCPWYWFKMPVPREMTVLTGTQPSLCSCKVPPVRPRRLRQEPLRTSSLASAASSHLIPA